MSGFQSVGFRVQAFGFKGLDFGASGFRELGV